MICSYPAGGQTDLLARAYGEFISKQVGKTVVVENKPGASGAIGTAEVARAEPDGHTILCSISTTYIMNRVVMKNPGYDMDKDLTLVSVIPGAGLLLVANPKTGVKTLEDFVAFARKSGKVNFGTYSAGSAPHMTINELNKQYGLSIEPVHYRGEAPMWTGMLEGTLDAAMGSYTAAQSVLQSDRGTVFAVHSKKVDAIPAIKTLPEQGATSKFFTVSGFSGLGRAEGDAAAGGRPPGGALRRRQQRSEGEGGSRDLRARAGHRLQGDQCPVSARVADLDRERAVARPRAGLNLPRRTGLSHRSPASDQGLVSEAHFPAMIVRRCRPPHRRTRKADRMTPDGVAVAVMITLLFPMGYFTLASPAFLLVKLDIQPVAQLLRGMFNAHFLVMRVAGVIGALAFLLDGRLVAAMGVGLLAALAIWGRRWFMQRIDDQLRARDAGDAEAPHRLRRLHWSGMLGNAVLLVALVTSIPYVAISA
ncbi:hypothetical protein ACVWZR_006674 [Bradyrhizobium sp. i1.3.1]